MFRLPVCHHHHLPNLPALLGAYWYITSILDKTNAYLTSTTHLADYNEITSIYFYYKLAFHMVDISMIMTTSYKSF